MNTNLRRLVVLSTVLALTFLSLSTATADSWNVDLTSQLFQPWANSDEIAIDGDYAYVATHQGFIVVDISDPANLVPVGSFSALGSIEGLDVADGYVYLADSILGLLIVDISDPENPVEVFRTQLYQYSLRDILVDGTLLYALDSQIGIQVIDVSDPTAPFWIAVGAFGRYSQFDKQGDYLYLLSGIDNEFEVVDVSDPYDMQIVGLYPISIYPYVFDVDGDLACFIDQDDGLVVFDISDPTNPIPVAIVETYLESQGLKVSDEIVYITDPENGLHVVDLSDPSEPVEIGLLGLPEGNTGVFVDDDDVAYVSSDMAALFSVDVSIPSAPAEIARITNPTAIKAVVAEGDYAYLADEEAGFFAIDVQDLNHPSIVGNLNDNYTALDLDVSGDYAYLADNMQGMRIINVSDPANPAEVSTFVPDDDPHFLGVNVDGNYAYIADVEFGVYVVDVSDPANPQQTSYGISYRRPYDLVKSDDYLYIAENNFGLWILDASDPTDLALGSELELDGGTCGIVLDGDLAILVGWDNPHGTMHIVDVSDPLNPVLLSTTTFNGPGVNVSAETGYAYVAANGDGTRVFNIEDPTAPVEVGYFVGPSYIQNVATYGSHVIATGMFCVYILDPSAALSVDEPGFDEHPTRFTLSPVYPNPFNAMATATLTLPASGSVHVSLYNMLGQHVLIVADGTLSTGVHTFTINANGLASGVYLMRADFTDGASVSRKITLVR